MAAAIFWYNGIDYTGTYKHVDLAQYRAMAQTVPAFASDIAAPFAYRILPSWMVGLLFSNDVAGFRVLTILSMILTALVMNYWLLRKKISQNVTLVTVLTLIFNPYIYGLTLFDYFQLCDALTLLFVALMMISIEDRRPVLFGIVLGLGAMTREINLVMIPTALYFFWRVQPDHSTLKKFAVASLPAVAVFLLLRTFIVVPNTEWNLQHAFSEHSQQALDPVVWVRLIFNTCVPLSLLLLFFYNDTKMFFKNNPHYFVFFTLTFLATFFGVNAERLFAPVYFVVYYLIARIIEKYSLLVNTWFCWVLFFATLVGSTHFIVAHIAVQQKLIYYSAAILAEIVLACTALLVAKKNYIST